MKTKQCNQCLRIKRTEEFYKNKAYRNDINARCKECCRATNKIRRDKNKRQNKSKNNTVRAGTKRCPKCRMIKNANSFHKALDKHDGLKPLCKECRNKAKKIHRNINRDQINRQQRAYVLKQVREITDVYVKGLLTNKNQVERSDLTMGLLEVKCLHLKIKRELKSEEHKSA